MQNIWFCSCKDFSADLSVLLGLSLVGRSYLHGRCNHIVGRNILGCSRIQDTINHKSSHTTRCKTVWCISNPWPYLTVELMFSCFQSCFFPQVWFWSHLTATHSSNYRSTNASFLIISCLLCWWCLILNFITALHCSISMVFTNSF